MNIHHHNDLFNEKGGRVGKILEDISHCATHDDAGRRAVPAASAADQRWLAGLISKAAKGPDTIIDDITPGRAAALLQRNVRNRELKEQSIAEMAADMRNGKWDLNGETIILSSEGLLNDGQNRCWAAIDSGKSFRTYIAVGVSRESRLSVDQGRVRKTGDYLRMENGTSKADSAAAAAKLLWLYKQNRSSDSGKFVVTKAMIRAEYQANADDIDEAVARVARGQMRFRGAYTVAANVILGKVNKAAAAIFIERLTKGTGNLSASDPIFVLRESLTSSKGLSAAARLELILRHWNAWRKNKKLTNGRRLVLKKQYPEKLEY